MPEKVKFEALLVPSGAFVCLGLPKEASERLGRRGRIPVIGALNGYGIRTSVFPMGDGTHMMLVNREMQKGARVKVGDRVEVVLELDVSLRTIEVPEDLAEALSRNVKASTAFEMLSYSHKKEYVSYIEEAKRPETRARRIEKTVGMLLSGRKSGKE